MACPLLLRRSSAGGPELRQDTRSDDQVAMESRPRRAAVAERPARSRCWARVFAFAEGFRSISHPARYWINRASLCNALGASVGRSIRGVSVIGAAETSRVMVNWNARRRQTW